MGINVFNCLNFNFKAFAKEIVICETIEPESTKALNFWFSNLTFVSFGSPINLHSGSGLR